MAGNKVTFASLKLKMGNIEEKEFTFNDKVIKVKQYLPIQNKLELIGDAISLAQAYNGTNGFRDPVKLEVFGVLGLVEYYTNITFTDKQKEEPTKLYDLLEYSGLTEQIIKLIPESEYDYIIQSIEEVSDEIYKYNNSILGILQQVSQDYSDMDFNAQNIVETLKDPAAVPFLKDVMTKLG